MFSVVIPLYNKELSVRNTINSVLNQTFKEFEILVVNDGSTDNSAEIVEQIDDSRIRLIHQANQGVSAARNKGIKEAKYEWIAFLDGDDLWKENHLEEVSNLICKYPDIFFFVTNYSRDTDLKEKENNLLAEELVQDYYYQMLQKHFINTNSVVINKKVVKGVGLFNESIVVGEDLEYWGRIAKEFELIRSNKVTALYRLEAENRSDKVRLELSKTIFTHINLHSEMTHTEYIYYGRLIINKIRSLIHDKHYSSAFKLMKIHNYKLLLTIFKYFRWK